MFNNSSSVVAGNNVHAPSGGLLPNGNPFAMPQSHFIEEEDDGYSPNNNQEDEENDNSDPAYFNANNESAPSGVQQYQGGGARSGFNKQNMSATGQTDPNQVADEELKKKIALYYHTLVINIDLTYIVPRKFEPVVRPVTAEKLHEAHQEAVHRLEHAHSEVFDLGLRLAIGLRFSFRGLENRYRA